MDWERIFESPKYLKRFLQGYRKIYETAKSERGALGFSSILKNSYYNSDNENFYLFLLDFEKLLTTSELTKKQKMYIDLFICGYTEQEVADYYGKERSGVSRTIISSCKKIITKREENKDD